MNFGGWFGRGRGGDDGGISSPVDASAQNPHHRSSRARPYNDDDYAGAATGATTSRRHPHDYGAATTAVNGAAEAENDTLRPSLLLASENEELRRKIDELEGRNRNLEERLVDAEGKLLSVERMHDTAAAKKKRNRTSSKKRKRAASSSSAEEGRHCVECEVCGTPVYGLMGGEDGGDANETLVETNHAEDSSDQEEGTDDDGIIDDNEDAELSLQFLEETTPNPVLEGEDGPLINTRSDRKGAFRQRCNWLRAYKMKNGHCNVSSRDRINKSLEQFIRKVRIEHKSYVPEDKSTHRLYMTPNRVRTLEDIGIRWRRVKKPPVEKPPPVFDQMFPRLKAFNDEYGHCCVPVTVVDANDDDRRELSEWAKKQMYNLRVAKWAETYRHGKRKRLTQEHTEALEGLGCIWLTCADLEEEENVARDVSNAVSGLDGGGKEKEKGSDDDDGRDCEDLDLSLRFLEETTPNPMLEGDDGAAINLRSDPKGAFRQRCNWLRAYKNKHGHCDVPNKDKSNKELAFFVSKCRGQHNFHVQGRMYKHGLNLTPNRIKTLEDIGIRWPQSCNDDTADGEERAAVAVGEGSSESKDEEVKKAAVKKVSTLRSWFKFYEELRNYKRVHGDCWVPTYNVKYGLGWWVLAQRRMYRRISNGSRTATTVEEHKIKLLRDMGLELDPDVVKEKDYERRRKKDIEEQKAKDEEKGAQLAKAKKDVEDALAKLEGAKQKKEEAIRLADLARKEVVLARKSVKKAKDNVEAETKKNALDPVGQAAEIAARGNGKRSGKAVITGHHRTSILDEEVIFYNIKWPEEETEIGVEGRFVSFVDKDYQRALAEERGEFPGQEDVQDLEAVVPSRVRTRAARRKAAEEASGTTESGASGRKEAEEAKGTAESEAAARRKAEEEAKGTARSGAARKKRTHDRTVSRRGRGVAGASKRHTGTQLRTTQSKMAPGTKTGVNHPTVGKYACVGYRGVNMRWGWAQITAVNRPENRDGYYYREFYCVYWPDGQVEMGIPEWAVMTISDFPYVMRGYTEATSFGSSFDGKHSVAANIGVHTKTKEKPPAEAGGLEGGIDKAAATKLVGLKAATEAKDTETTTGGAQAASEGKATTMEPRGTNARTDSEAKTE